MCTLEVVPERCTGSTFFSLVLKWEGQKRSPLGYLYKKVGAEGPSPLYDHLWKLPGLYFGFG